MSHDQAPNIIIEDASMESAISKGPVEDGAMAIPVGLLLNKDITPPELRAASAWWTYRLNNPDLAVSAADRECCLQAERMGIGERTMRRHLRRLRAKGAILPTAERVLPAEVRRRRRSLSMSARFHVLERDGFRCQYCGRGVPELRAGEELVVDHILPLAHGGTNDPSNLTTACSACNSGKHTRETNRFREAM